MDFRSGAALLAGKYRLIRQLGQGSMGSVWQAEYLTLRAPVAIKLMDPVLAQDPEAVGRFLREARAAAALRSPHVVQIFEYGVDAATPFIAMELLEGESLGAKLERVSCLSPAETASILTHIARAIGRAHEAGIIHRDLKPDNIFLLRNDDELLAKLLDFGIAKRTGKLLEGSSGLGTRTGTLLGTALYMSPEQAQAWPDVDHRTDIWAMGAIAFECLIGRHPFHGETFTAIVLAICARDLPIPSRFGPVPGGFDAWFLRACARDRSQRFGSAKEAASELRRLCEATEASPKNAGRKLSGSPRPSAGARRSAAAQPGNVVTEERAGRSSLVWVESATDRPVAVISPRTKLSVTPYAGVLFGVACLVAGGAIGAHLVRRDESLASGAPRMAATLSSDRGSVPSPAPKSALGGTRFGPAASSSPDATAALRTGAEVTKRSDPRTPPWPDASVSNAASVPALAPAPDKAAPLSDPAREAPLKAAPKGSELQLRLRR